MNWMQLLSNLGGAALIGGAAAAKMTPAGQPLDWRVVAGGAGVTALMAGAALFQTPPHQNG